MKTAGSAPGPPSEVARTRATVHDLIDDPDPGDADQFVRRLVGPIDQLLTVDPDPTLALRAALVARQAAARTSDRRAEALAARSEHLARRAALDRDGAGAALIRLRRAAEAAGGVESLYEATWFELVAAATSADRFGVRRSIGALRSFATAGRSHRAVALHRAARCLADAITGNVALRGAWSDGTAFVDDHRLRSVLSGWAALQDGRAEDARFALDRTMEAGTIDVVPAPLRPAALMIAGRTCASLAADEHAPAIATALEPHAGTFVVTGPQPIRWLGSVDLILAELAVIIGDRTLAASRVGSARDSCDSLGATSMVVRLGLVDDALRRAPGSGHAPRPSGTPAPVDGHEVVLRRTGSMWQYRRGSVDVVLRHRKGFEQLRRLLAEPGREHHCADLVQPGARREPGIEMLDDRARAAYRARYEELTAAIAEAESWNDDEREFRAREELSALADELGRGLGLGGRLRTTGSTAERARVNATRTIRAATTILADHDPVFGAHLDRCIRTGVYCTYESDGSFHVDC